MLQQTTVAHALRYFAAFTQRWPTVHALAHAPHGDVMAAWAGLGYYARARNLIACARTVVERHSGEFPASEAMLRTLPGIGAYTAAAIAAIAFDLPTNVVDANVERVLARLFAIEASLPGAKPQLHRLAARLVTGNRPGDWAQALMDLGATICRPAPICRTCPIARHCAAMAQGTPADYPRRDAKPLRPRRFGAVFVSFNGDKVGLVRRPATGLLGGMLGVPAADWRAEPWTGAEVLAAAPMEAAWEEVGSLQHVFTHFSLTLEVLRAQCNAQNPAFVWVSFDQALAETPTVFRKALRLAMGS